MMLINRKEDPKSLKPNRFNLGGLIKKKITWRRSIDSLAATLDHVQIDYNTPLASSTAHYSTAPSEAYLGQNETFGDDFNKNYEMAFKHYTHVHHPEERYTSFTTECISLLNSDMTSHMDENEDEIDSESCYDHEVDEDVHCDTQAEENPADYRAGGYHPVKIGDQLLLEMHRYRILRKLGWGHFSTVWLGHSLISGKFVALKVVKLGKNYLEAAADEIRILKGLQEEDEAELEPFGPRSGNSNVVELLDNFVINGPNGTHSAMVFELMGENMLHLIYKQKARKLTPKKVRLVLPADMVKLIVHQILQSVHFMHHKGVIHTDLKPENILLTYEGVISEAVRHPKASGHFHILPLRPLALTMESICSAPVNVKVADLGNATYSNHHFTNHIQTRQYRAPEILLKHKSWGALADVWSVGCLIFELLTGDYLFDPHDGETFDKHEDHLAQIIELLGEFPSEKYLQDCELAPKYFSSGKSLVNIRTLKFWSLENVLVEKYKFDANDDNVKLVCDLILKCLKYDLNERYDCGSLLDHPWFSANAKYDKEELDALPNHNSEIAGFTCED